MNIPYSHNNYIKYFNAFDLSTSTIFLNFNGYVCMKTNLMMNEEIDILLN